MAATGRCLEKRVVTKRAGAVDASPSHHALMISAETWEDILSELRSWDRYDGEQAIAENLLAILAADLRGRGGPAS
jgi:hypothetical protein